MKLRNLMKPPETSDALLYIFFTFLYTFMPIGILMNMFIRLDHNFGTALKPFALDFVTIISHFFLFRLSVGSDAPQ